MADDASDIFANWTTATANGNQVISVPGMANPKAVIFIVHGAVTQDVLRDHVGLGYGAADGTTQASLSPVARDAASPSETSTTVQNAFCISFLEETGAAQNLRQATFVSMTDGSVTINWTSAPSQAFLCTIWVIQGADAIATVGVYNGFVGPTTVTIDVGAEFDPVYAFSGRIDGSSLPYQNATLRFGVGCFHGPGLTPPQCCQAHVSWDNDTPVRVRVATYDNNFVSDHTVAGLVEALRCTDHRGDSAPYEFDFVRISGGNAVRPFFYVAVKYGDRRFYGAVLDSPTTTADWLIPTGWEANSMVMWGSNNQGLGFTNSGSQVEAHAFGRSNMTAGSTQCGGYFDGNNVSPTNNASYRAAKLFRTYTASGPTINADLGTPSAEATQIRVPVDVAPAAAHKWLVFAVEKSGGVPPVEPELSRLALLGVG